MNEQDLSERSLRKRESILKAATELFLDKGYASTSMDEIAAKAKVSKQTVYKHFRDKETLFRNIVDSTITRASSPFQSIIREAETAPDLSKALRTLARRYIRAVTQPELLRRRQLVVREAGRHPDLARAYHDGAPSETIRHLAETFGRLAERGDLRAPDPHTAAVHFAFLILGQTLDMVMFRGTDEIPTTAALEKIADAGTEAFLAIYARR